MNVVSPEVDRKANEVVLTELLAEIYNGVEGLDGEVDPAVEVSHVGQLNPQHLVHRREVEHRVCGHTVLVQGAPRPRQPVISRRPPQRVIRPVHGNVCKRLNKQFFYCINIIYSASR